MIAKDEYVVVLRKMDIEYNYQKTKWELVDTDDTENEEEHVFTTLESAIKAFDELELKTKMDNCVLVPMIEYGESCQIEHFFYDDDLCELEFDDDFDKSENYYKESEIPVFGEDACIILVCEMEKRLDALNYNYQIEMSGAERSYETFYIKFFPIDENVRETFEIRISNHDSNHGSSNVMLWLSDYFSVDSLFKDVIDSISEPEFYHKAEDVDSVFNIEETDGRIESTNKKCNISNIREIGR